ncbi:MAG: hypothetical protein HGA47_02170 [Zoogloea sp.]|nr:hypothetical protein [Zoogloea sp.]
MGEAKRRRLAGLDAQRMQGDVRKLSESELHAYIKVSLERAKEVTSKLHEGEQLYAAFEPMLRFVVGSKYLGACHDTSAVLYMQLRQAGLQEADVALCCGEVKAQGSRFDHSWVEVRGQVFDVAICAPNEVGQFASGAVFAGVDLRTNAPARTMFGVASEDPLEDAAATVCRMNLHEYLDFQVSIGCKSMVDLAHEVYGVDGHELLAKYGNVNREWRNPLLNPNEGAV